MHFHSHFQGATHTYLVEHVHFHPILLSRVNHFDMHSVDHAQYYHCDVVADHVHCDFVHPIPLNHFDYVDSGLVLVDLTDNIPVDESIGFGLHKWK